MAYKDMVMVTLTQTAIDERDNVYFKMAQEVEEVYCKAKAFDKVIELTKTEFVSEDLADNIRILVNDYEFDLERE